jgi:VWFA-related protein
VLQRCCVALCFALFLGGLATPGQSQGTSQAAPPAESAHPVFKANARIVVLDVVVSGMKGRPVRGLHKEDFLVSEDGKPQTVAYFEEHSGTRPLRTNLPDRAPNVFTNIPAVKPSDSVMVLVLDSLNTPLTDQNHVRAQVLKYLKKPQPGSRMAIFTLETQLRLVQSFTDDPALLSAAVNNRKSGAGTQGSPLLQSSAEKGADQEVVGALAEQSADMAAAMQQFLSDQTATRSGIRLQLTLDALQALAHYLAGIPGRKNVAWFSGGFPVVTLPDSGLPDPSGVQQDYQAQVKKTDALLTSAQMAIYPIGAEGVVTDSVYSAGVDARLTRQQLTKPGQQDAQEGNSNHAGMDEIAKDTGGAALYNTNDLSDALARVADHGSYFYTLTYTSANPATDGRFRKIQVKLPNSSGGQLAYRQGYYADDAESAQAAAAQPAPKPVANPLSPFLLPGRPDSSQIPLTLRVVRGSVPPGAGQGGDNHNLQGPLTRYSVDFLIPAHGLQFDPAPDGRRQVSLEAALVVYDHEAQPINWMLRQINLNLDAKQYATAQANGVNLFFEIDAPGEGSRLRSGVYDLRSNLAGTLEIPLSTIVNPDPTTSSR